VAKTKRQHALTSAEGACPELVRVEQSKVLGFAAPGDETFTEIATRFLAHQKARLTPKAYKRETGIVK
jgi:hypothetical protein